MLLDLHPRADAARKVEVRLGDPVIPAGRLARKAFFVADIRGAERALQSAVSERLFSLEEEAEFDFAEHFDTVATWLSCLAKPRVGAFVGDDDLIASARSRMATGEGEIIVTGRECAARLRRLE